MSEQLKKFTYKWTESDGWKWVDGDPFQDFALEVKMVRAEDADALAERLRECEAALEFYVSPMNWHVIGDSDLSVPEGLYYPRGGKRAREYFKKWRNK